MSNNSYEVHEIRLEEAGLFKWAEKLRERKRPFQRSTGENTPLSETEQKVIELLKEEKVPVLQIRGERAFSDGWHITNHIRSYMLRCLGMEVSTASRWHSIPDTNLEEKKNRL